MAGIEPDACAVRRVGVGAAIDRRAFARGIVSRAREISIKAHIKMRRRTPRSNVKCLSRISCGHEADIRPYQSHAIA